MGLQKTYKTEGTCALNKYVCLLSLMHVAIFIYSSVKRAQEMLLSKPLADNSCKNIYV